MPHEEMEWLPRQEILTYEEIERLASLFVSLGVDKVRLTGGEPTVRRDLDKLVEKLGGIVGLEKLYLTTNGATLKSLAHRLQSAGLSGINISLDTLDPHRFFEITRRGHFSRVLDGIEAALEVGFESVKINVVVMAGVNDDELCNFVHYFREQPVEIRFIEFMPFLANGWERAKMMPYKQMRETIEQKFKLVQVDTDKSAVAKEFRLEDSLVKVGFITSMTDHFCDGCNRIRITADGRLKVCLFSKTGPSLRDPLRAGASDDDLAEIIRSALNRKWAGHPPMSQLIQTNDRPMITIGG